LVLIDAHNIEGKAKAVSNNKGKLSVRQNDDTWKKAENCYWTIYQVEDALSHMTIDSLYHQSKIALNQ
jgi:hypothetical protein